MSKSDYRVVRRDHGKGRVIYAIHDAYYDARGKLTHLSHEPIPPVGESWRGLSRDIEEMATALGKPVVDAATLQEVAGHAHGSPDARGERNGNAKLTEADVRAIRAEHAAGRADQPTLAARFGIGRSSVSQILTGRKWGHVPLNPKAGGGRG